MWYWRSRSITACGVCVCAHDGQCVLVINKALNPQKCIKVFFRSLYFGFGFKIKDSKQVLSRWFPARRYFHPSSRPECTTRPRRSRLGPAGFVSDLPPACPSGAIGSLLDQIALLRALMQSPALERVSSGSRFPARYAAKHEQMHYYSLFLSLDLYWFFFFSNHSCQIANSAGVE